ncbi:MAG: hypothetical protein LBK95_20885 [Bifidobacteriaceae bacterium]|jgi:hypothetical protein|nr:hypothetical protein [Bifidobacteriaceae bacterium]
MGWNSYNVFGGTFFPEMADCAMPSCIPLNETRVKETAEAMIDAGLPELGYRYVNIDDRWQDPRVPRGADGKLRWDARRFPNGIPALAEWLHSRGLKLGLYVLPNERPCGGEEGPTNKPGWPSGLPETGSMGHEYLDAQTFADWGADYLKFDWCGVNESGRNGKAAQVFRLWDQAIQASGRDMLVAASTWGWEHEERWGPQYAHTWRIDADVAPAWGDVMRTLDKGSTSVLRAASGPAKGWNDFDTMQVGNPGLTPAESRSHFVMWAMGNSPLMLGNDLRNIDSGTLSLITNEEVIAVNQDLMGEQAWKAASSGGLEVWARSLQDGSKAVALLNRSSAAATIRSSFADVHLGAERATVRDLTDRADKGVFDGSYAATVQPHDTVLLKVVPAVVHEFEDGALSAGAQVQECGSCSGGKNVGFVGNAAGEVTLTVGALSAGDYSAALFYNSGVTRTLYYSVNGGTGQVLVGLDSGAWGTVASRNVELALVAGDNTIRFYQPNPGAWAPDLDKLEIEGIPPSRYIEAELGVVGGSARIQDCSTCSGGANVGYIGNNDGDLTISVASLASGPAELTIYYLSAGLRSLSMDVNGQLTWVVNRLDSGGWETVAAVTRTVQLVEGVNTIRLYQPYEGGWAPNIDRIRLVSG